MSATPASQPATEQTFAQETRFAHDFSQIPAQLAQVATGLTVRLSGGGIFSVYGTPPAAVNAVIADGWLSKLDQAALAGGPHIGEGDDHVWLMELLTQRALTSKDNEITSKLSPSEKNTWESLKKVPLPAPPTADGATPDRVEHYLDWVTTSFFEVPAPGTVPTHVANMRIRIDAIDAEPDIAPDDKVALRRIQYLHYVRAYPNPAMRTIAVPPVTVPLPTYQALMGKQSRSLVALNNLALSLGLPATRP